MNRVISGMLRVLVEIVGLIEVSSHHGYCTAGNVDYYFDNSENLNG